MLYTRLFAEDMARWALYLWVTGAEKGVLDSDAVYIKAELLLCFKYFLKDEGTNDGALTVTKGV